MISSMRRPLHSKPKSCCSPDMHQSAPEKAKPLRLSFVDIRKAYFNGVPRRDVFMSLPKELGLPPNLVAKQIRCVYGTRDGGLIWEDCYRSALEDMGFKSGIASPCCFPHPARVLHVVVHGDDFTCLGLDEGIDYYKTQLAKRFEVKIRGRLGIGCELTKIKILNRVVRIKGEGPEYEADPRHTELVTGSLGLTAANAVKTPGVKDPVPDYSITTCRPQQWAIFIPQIWVCQLVVQSHDCARNGFLTRRYARVQLVMR